MIDLEKLSIILSDEREGPAPLPADAGLQAQINGYIDELKSAQDSAESYREQSMISDEMKNVRMVCEGIRDRRFSKISNYAALAAVGAHLEITGLTESERQAYEILLTAMKQAIVKVFPVVS